MGLRRVGVVTRSTAGTAKQLHLNRAARVAGEAFAFVEPESARAVSQLRAFRIGGFVWLMLGAAAAAALFAGF
jgi:hypothetical protein